MASLSCLSTVKSTRSRVPSCKLLEADDGPINSTRRGRASTKSRRLFPVEIVEEKGHEVRIYFTGYSTRHDQWMRKSQIQYMPIPVSSGSSTSTEDQLSRDYSILACNIKQRLNVSRKVEDPKVRIQIPFTNASFNLFKSKGVLLDKGAYGISSYDVLDEFLGEQWYLRIANTNGDFSYVLLSTIRFHAVNPKPLLDFSVNVTQADSELSFKPYYTMQESAIVFEFVKKDGNKRKLLALLGLEDPNVSTQ